MDIKIDWKKNYAFGFRRPSIQIDEIFESTEIVVNQLNSQLQMVSPDLVAEFKKIDDNNAEIILPNAKGIDLNLINKDFLQIKDKSSSASANITTADNQTFYNITYVNFKDLENTRLCLNEISDKTIDQIIGRLVFNIDPIEHI